MLSTELIFEVLCFLSTEFICKLVVAGTVTRLACSVRTTDGWRLVMPHLMLSSKSCRSMLAQVWLPRTKWLEGRGLDAKACRVLNEAFERTGCRAARALVTLDLTNAKFCSALVVVSVARACQGLRLLNLSRTRLRDEGAECLARGLVFDPDSGHFSPHRELRCLALDENGLTGAVGTVLADVVTSVPLEVLRLAQNAMADPGAIAIASSLMRSCPQRSGVRLTRLDLSRNSLTCLGLVAILRALGSNRTLHSLDVGGNESVGADLALSGESTEAFSVCLGSAAGLRDLHLWRCGISDAVFKLVVDSAPPTLRKLSLATNPISGEVRRQVIQRTDGVICI